MQVYKRDILLKPGSVALLRMGSSFELSSREGYGGLGILAENPQLPQLQGESKAFQATVQMHSTADLLEHYLLIPNTEGKHSIRNLARAIIWEAIDAESRQLERHPEKWPEIAKGILDVNLSTGVPARKALAHVPLCYRQLSRLFKASYGMSPKQYQIAARVQQAKRMLSSSQTSITDIAMELGFASSQHFTTQFKAVTGMTPSQFAASSVSNFA